MIKLLETHAENQKPALRFDTEKWKIGVKNMPTPRQNNAEDCGIFVSAIAELISRSTDEPDLNITPKDILRIRREMAEDLVTGELRYDFAKIIVDQAWKHRNEEKDIQLTIPISEATITYDALASFLPGSLVHKDILLVYFILVALRSSMLTNFPNTQTSSLEFFGRYLAEGYEFAMTFEKSLDDNFNPLAGDIVLIPYYQHLPATVANKRKTPIDHYTLIVIYPKEQQIHQYNPRTGSPQADLNKVLELLESHARNLGFAVEKSKWKPNLKNMRTPQRTNGEDTGIFVAVIAERISRSLAKSKLDFGPKDISRIRREMAEDLVKGYVRPPS